MKKLLLITLLLSGISGFAQQYADFFSGGIWLLGTGGPSSTTGSLNYLIISGTPTFSANHKLNNLHLNGGTANIPNGFTINGNVENFGTVNFLGDQTIGGILTGSGAVFVNGQFFQNSTSANTNTNSQIQAGGQGNSNAYNFISSPVTSTQITRQFGGSNPCDMFVFDAPNQDWGWDIEAGPKTCNGVGVIFDAGNTVSGADGFMDIARGYTVSGGGQPVYRGIFNNGTKNITLSSGPSNPNWSGNSWNLIGNPYPSAVDGASFLAGNGSISGTIYFWDDDGSGGAGYDQNADYATWTNGGGVPSNSGQVPNGSIPVGQGFFVSGTGTATFTNAMRGGNNSQFFKTESEPIKRVWLNAVNANGFKSTILLAFTDSATVGFDRTYDGERFIQKQDLLFGTQINTEGCYIIQCQNNITEPTDRVIDVMLRVREDNTVSINLDHFENFYSNKDILFLDTETGKSQNLANGPFAVYLKAYQNYDGRFKVIIRDNNITTSTPNLSELDVKTIANREQLTIDFNGKSFKEVTMFSTNGQRIMHNNVNGKSTFTYPTNHIEKGIYILKLTDSQNHITTKRVGIF